MLVPSLISMKLIWFFRIVLSTLRFSTLLEFEGAAYSHLPLDEHFILGTGKEYSLKALLDHENRSSSLGAELTFQ